MEPNTSQHKWAKTRRTLWFMLFLLVLVVAAVVGAARLVLNNAQNSLVKELNQSMSNQAQTQAAQLTVWYGALYEQAAQLSGQDQIRLFASEVHDSDLEATALLHMGNKKVEEDVTFLVDDSALTGLDAQAPILRHQLQDFISKYGLLSATLYNIKQQAYVSTLAENGIQPLSNAQIAAMKDTLAQRQPKVTPAHLDREKKLVLDIVLPVFAPRYVDSSGQKCVAFLVLSINVSAKIAEFTRVADQAAPVESVRLLQRSGDTVQELLTGGVAPIELPGWKLEASGGLPLAVRTLPARGSMPETVAYTLAVPVANLPWLVEHDLPLAQADARYATFQRSVMVSAVLVSLLAGLILFMLWWWLLARGERAVAKELRQLYETVNQQKQIIDGVNSSLADGIVLSSLDGSIPYANQAFAEMAEEMTTSLVGKACRNLASPEVSRNLVVHTEEVLKLGTPKTYMNTLSVKGQRRNYQVSCTPFLNAEGAITGVVSVYSDLTELLTAQQRAQHMVNQTVNVFVRAIEAVDPYLRGQSTQTGVLAVALAHLMGMSEREATLRVAANLSQIGMIQLPHSLLTKTGSLTSEERVYMQKHMEYARNVLDGIDFGLPVLDAITQMHERLDGSGYPLHLTGDAIGQDSRILAVANTFCALLRPRSYRQARALEDAINILSHEPYQYDPAVVQALRDFLETPAGQEFYAELVKV